MTSEKVTQTCCRPNTHPLQLGEKIKEWTSVEPGMKSRYLLKTSEQ